MSLIFMELFCLLHIRSNVNNDVVRFKTYCCRLYHSLIRRFLNSLCPAWKHPGRTHGCSKGGGIIW
jgi:hypothetical protein